MVGIVGWGVMVVEFYFVCIKYLGIWLMRFVRDLILYGLCEYVLYFYFWWLFEGKEVWWEFVEVYVGCVVNWKLDWVSLVRLNGGKLLMVLSINGIKY